MHVPRAVNYSANDPAGAVATTGGGSDAQVTILSIAVLVLGLAVILLTALVVRVARNVQEIAREFADLKLDYREAFRAIAIKSHGRSRDGQVWVKGQRALTPFGNGRGQA